MKLVLFISHLTIAVTTVFLAYLAELCILKFESDPMVDFIPKIRLNVTSVT